MTGGLIEVHNAAFAAPAVVWPQIGVRQLVGGLDNPTNITNAGDGSGRIFVTEEGGTIRIVRAGALLQPAFLDISGRVDSVYREGGRGLIGLAFPPGFAQKQHFYVAYTKGNGDIILARYGLTNNPDIADPQSEAVIMSIPHPDSAFHYGGQLAFGPKDGYLYFSIGDGGPQADPQNHAQSLGTLLGKVLRIDVESGTVPYAIPPTNPFVLSGTARHEVWAYGLRNPWRLSFDRVDGDLYLGDVGYNTYEEIDFQSAASAGGENYGWHIMEGLHCTGFSNPCPVNGLTSPVLEYNHSTGNVAVMGGYVYRGPHNQLMQGKYFYGDFISGNFGALAYDGAVWQQSWLSNAGFPISTFGEDETGNLYVANYGTTVSNTGAIDIISSAGVDGWLESASPVGGPPGGTASSILSVGNYGIQTAASVIVSATLAAGLGFASASPTPTYQAGNILAWALPAMAFQSTAQIALKVNLPAAAYGTRYPISWQLSSSGPEANPQDNVLTTQVMVAHQLFLPGIVR